MNENNQLHSFFQSSEMTDLLGRLFRMRRHFHAILPENLSLFQKRIRQTILDGKAEGADDYNQFYQFCMVFLNRPGSLTMGEVSQALDVPLSTATRIVDWFVKNDYITRIPDPEDRRIVRVTLTETGQDLYRAINEFFMERVERILQQFTPEEKRQFIYLLYKLLNAMENEP